MTAANPNPTPEEKEAALQRVREARKALGRALPVGIGKEPTEAEKERFEAARAELEAATQAMKALGVEDESASVSREEFLKGMRRKLN